MKTSVRKIFITPPLKEEFVERRANLTMTIAKDFYGEDIIGEVMSNDKEIDDDIIKRITSDPELQKRTLAALLSNLG